MNYKSKYLKYKNKNFDQTGGDIFGIKKYHSKRSICSKKKFDNDEVFKEVFHNDLLNELHSEIIKTGQPDQIQNYKSTYGELESLVNNTIDRIKRDNKNVNINITTLNLASYYLKNKKFPPKMVYVMIEEEKSNIGNIIDRYKQQLLSTANIGNHMCSVLYDKYMSSARVDNDNTEIFRHVLQTTIKKFDSDDDIMENFNLFHSKFSETFKKLALELGVCYLDRGNNLNNLILAKTDSGIKSMLDLNKQEELYLKTILNNYIQTQNTKKEDLNDEQNSRNKRDMKQVSNEISRVEESINKSKKIIEELEKKQDNYNQKLSTVEGLQSITENEKMTDSDYKDLSFNKDMIFKFNDTLRYTKRRMEDIQRRISQIRNEEKESGNINKLSRFFLTPQINEEYHKKIIECMQENRNILVPITLLDITRNNQVTNVNQLMLSKDNMSLRLKLHSNMLFINTEKKYIEHFEPHGVSGTYNSHQVADILKEESSKIPELSKYNFVNQNQMCPIIEGPQALDRSYYCYIHSGYYAMLRILYPDKSGEELGMMLISKINKHFKDDDQLNVDKSSLDYLNKKYIRLSGPEIKTRLENFMKWHRYIVDFMNSPNKKLVEQLQDMIKNVIPPLRFD
jgi:hypothetical protein